MDRIQDIKQEELVIDFNNVTLEYLQTGIKPKRKYTRKPKVSFQVRVRPQKNVDYFLYHEGKADSDTMTFIKKFQNLLDSNNLGSHVQIVTCNGFETYGIHDLFSTQNPMKNWIDFKPSHFNCICINIQEKPTETVESLFEKSKLY
jgi:pyruvate dehydrogenase complex dehydrogenase (E1) component